MKKILGSSVMIVMAIAVIIGGTNAFFSDTQVSQGNVMAAGSIDLKVNHSMAMYNGINCDTCLVTISSDTSNMVIAKNEDSVTPYNAIEPIDPGPNWASPFGDAIWIWGEEDKPDANDTTSYTFQKEFVWQGDASGATILMDLAADDDFIIHLNGNLVDQGTAAWQNSQSINVPSGYFNQGLNELEIKVTNSGGHRAGLLYELKIEQDECEQGSDEWQWVCKLWESKDLEDEKFFEFYDVKPGDYGSNLISLTVTDNEAYMCLAVNNKEDEELGIGGGSLGDHLYVKGYYADGYGNKGDIMFGPTKLNELNNITYADSTTNPDVPPVTPGDTNYVLLEWCFGEYSNNGFCNGNVSEINDTQLAQYLADLQFYAIQTRSNDEFNCQELEFPVSQNNQ